MAVGTSAAPRVRWEDIFRGYDIRGRYPREIDAELARRLGRAVGRALPGPFLLGRDTRRESDVFARELTKGLRSQGAHVDSLGIMPTPEVAFQSRRWKVFGLAVTPSHNPLGYVGLKGFTPTGRLFDREWRQVRETYGATSRERRAGAPRRRAGRSPSKKGSGSRRRFGDEYLRHLTQGLKCDLLVVLETRGGATARVAPSALRRIGARVVEMTSGYSARFFGLSPEPRPETLSALARKVTSVGADLGVAFDGDGDRCVILDERGHRVDPEVIALLLHRFLAPTGSPIVASVDASRMLGRHARTIYSRVGGRYVSREMRRARAEVGVEPSGHYYLRRYGADSDGILTACLVAHALGMQCTPLSTLSRRFGPSHRGTSTVDFRTMEEARQGYREIVRGLGKRTRSELEGVTVDLPGGWCLIRRSNTQPSIRFAFEATGSAALRRLKRAVHGLSGGGQAGGAVGDRAPGARRFGPP